MVLSAGGVTLILDAGVAARRLAAGLDALSIPESDVAAVLVTHEHHDHVCGLGPVSRRFRAPVVATRGTHEAVSRRLGRDAIGVTIAAGDTLTFGGLSVTAFATSHDCAEPVGYTVSDGSATVAVATDLGHVSQEVHDRLAGADALILESNHDERMLLDGRYPWHLKRRIMGRRGHLSNAAAASALSRLSGSRLSLVVLAHLSQENNDPALAADAAFEALDGAGLAGVDLHVASQHALVGPFEVLAARSASAPITKTETAWRR
jgi:phosphoribosyl 1,2-cyclic phosphodiesterase